MKSPLHQIGEIERLELLRPIFASMGEIPKETKPIGSGARSWVWRITSNRRHYAFKIYKPLEGALPPETDAKLRRYLTEKTLNISRPYLTSQTVSLPDLGYAWSLDQYIRGRRVPRSGLSPSQARRLGQTLRLLHEIEPKDLKDVPPIQASPPIPVALTFGAAFPESFERSLSSLTPSLAKTLQAILQFVTNFDQRHSICHADLHRKQLIQIDKQDLALIDFSEARLCNRNWDLGAVLLEFGRETYGHFCEGYEPDPAERHMALPFARCLAFARLHRGMVGRKRETRAFLRATENLKIP